MAQRSLNNLSPGKQYAVQVRTTIDGKNSDWSPVIYFTTISGGGTPSAPAAPLTVASNTMQLQITLSGKKADNVTSMEDFTSYYEVYASSSSGFTPDSSSMVGTISSNGPALIGVFKISPSALTGNSQTWYSKVIAVGNDGTKSTASAQSSASVDLIAGINIQDATITTAKINDLTANKITSGSITTATLTVGGDATTIKIDGTTGQIYSSNYVTNTSGWVISYDGSAEFNSIKLRTSIDIQSSTSSSANRVVITNTGIKAFNGSTNTFFADGSTGNVTITGNFTLDSAPGNSVVGVKIDSGTGKIYMYGAGSLGGYAPGELYSDTLYTYLKSPAYTGYTAGFLKLTPGSNRSNTVVELFGQIYTPDIVTGTFTALYIDTSTGQIKRASSSLKYKETIENYDISNISLDNLRLITYRDKSTYEDIGLEARKFPGVIAEELDQYPELRPFVLYNTDGKPDSVLYDRLALIAIGKLKDLESRVSVIENNI